MTTEMRWATRAEVAALLGDGPRPTSRFFGLVVDGEPLAIAALRYDPREVRLIVSVNMKPEARKRPVTLHRWAKKALEAAESVGATSFLVIADRDTPRSEAWVERLGLQRIGEIEPGAIYEWASTRRHMGR